MFSQMMSSYRKKVGNYGEEMARLFLIKKGYLIIEQNFKRKGGEIDIVAKDKEGQWVFVEVKTRVVNNNFLAPEDNFDNIKAKRFENTVIEYFRVKKIKDFNYRIDLMAVLVEKRNKMLKIRHTKAVD